MSRPNKIDTCRSWLSNPPNLDHLLHKYPPRNMKAQKSIDPGYFSREISSCPKFPNIKFIMEFKNCPIQDQLLMLWPWRGKWWKRCAGTADDPTLLALSWNAGCPNLSISSHIAGLATGLATKLVACYQFEGVRSTKKTWPNRSCWPLCTLQYQIPIRRHVKVTAWR